jgi:branched-chain amino acid transport system permease protein
MLEQLLLNCLLTGCTYTLVALGFSLIYSTTKIFHFAHGVVYTSGPYFAYLFMRVLRIDPIVSVCLSVIASIFVGVLIELTVYRPLRKKNASRLTLLVSSLGVYVVLQNTISLLFSDRALTLRRSSINVGMAILGARITLIQLVIIFVSWALLILFWILMRFTRKGTEMRAVASNFDLAWVCGVDTNKTILFAFVLGSALASVAGILISLDVDMTPTMGMNALMMGLVAVIIGGVGSIPGIAVGGFMLAFTQTVGIWVVSAHWQDTIAFGILILFFLFRPYGFFGKEANKARV